jgi:hypothetical protein
MKKKIIIKVGNKTSACEDVPKTAANPVIHSKDCLRCVLLLFCKILKGVQTVLPLNF